MKRRRKIYKPIRRKIVLSVGGRIVKTVRSYISLPQAVKEVGQDRFFTLGDNTKLRRRMANVTVLIEYVVTDDLTRGGVPYVETVDSNLNAAKLVIRAGVPV